jgi:hypothetical protein
VYRYSEIDDAPLMINATEGCSRISEEIRVETTGRYQRDWRG